MLSRNIITISTFALLAACQSTPTDLPSAETVGVSPPTTLPAEQAKETAQAQPEDLWERIRLELHWQSIDNSRVDKARAGFLRQSNYLAMIADRGDYYLYYIVEEVQKRGMPVEIALIPIVESTLDPYAESYSGAAGLWQIMPRTGKHLGLEQNTWYDGRQSLRDSTAGALDYLQSMYDRFDEDWLLALAAYNAGAGTVSKAQRANAAKGLGTDYWSLKLSSEPYNYVPKVIALAQIVASPGQYNVQIPTVENAPFFEVADAGRHLHFAQAAQLAGVEVEMLRALNPGQLRGTTSPHRPPELLLPVDSRNLFEANLAELSPEELVQWMSYRIQRGDSLGIIAEKFGTPVSLLQEVNGISGSHIQTGDTLKIPGALTPDNSLLLASADSAVSPRGYRVRTGDSLYLIANKFKVSVSDLISWNALDPGAYLQPGQQLTLYGTGG